MQLSAIFMLFMDFSNSPLTCCQCKCFLLCTFGKNTKNVKSTSVFLENLYLITELNDRLNCEMGETELLGLAVLPLFTLLTGIPQLC